MTIEEKAIKTFGLTTIHQFAGYILANGDMLNFSYGGYQRDEDHRSIGQFFSKAQGTEALLKFMRRGNIRVMCHRDSYHFEFIKKPTYYQLQQIRLALKDCLHLNIPISVEKDDSKGRPIRVYNDMEIYELFRETC